MIYEPIGPYVLQFPPYQGKSMEELMFEDYSYVASLPKRIFDKKYQMKDSTKLAILRHATWLLQQGGRVGPSLYCVSCMKRAATCLIVPMMNLEYFIWKAAERKCEECAQETYMDKKHLVSLRFSTFLLLNTKGDKEEFAVILRKVYQIKKSDPYLLFKFFQSMT